MLIGQFPTHVVVDTRDGMVFNAGADGQMFDYDTACAFAKQRNDECNPGMRSWAVFALRDCVSELSVGYDYQPRPALVT